MRTGPIWLELVLISNVPDIEIPCDVGSRSEHLVLLGLDLLNTKPHNMDILIVGFGRIGKILCKTLDGLGANVYCEARKYSDIAWIKAYGYNPIHINDLNKNISKFSSLDFYCREMAVGCGIFQKKHAVFQGIHIKQTDISVINEPTEDVEYRHRDVILFGDDDRLHRVVVIAVEAEQLAHFGLGGLGIYHLAFVVIYLERALRVVVFVADVAIVPIDCELAVDRNVDRHGAFVAFVEADSILYHSAFIEDGDCR